MARSLQSLPRMALALPTSVPAWRDRVHGEPARDVDPAGPKVLLYSHDTFGLGNIRRTLLLAGALRDEFPDAAVLIVTGSPVIHAFRIPDGIDYVKLPSLDRVAADRYEPRFLARWSSEVRQMRGAILKRAVLGFAPDLLVVDKRPGGVDGELLESLGALRAGGRATRVVLGMRDVLDDPERTRPALLEQGWFETLERFYDEVWIYGAPEVFDASIEYGFPEPVRERVRFTGYLGRERPDVAPPDGPPRVVVATGGGGDGSAMIEAYLEALRALPRSVELRTSVVLGPEMPAARRSLILGRFGKLSDVEFCDFDADPLPRYARAHVVVAMGGYNTVCELLSVGRPAVVVPRCEPVREQWIRARRLAQLGCIEMVDPALLTPSVLMSRVLAQLSRQAPPRYRPPLDGVAWIRERVRALLRGHDA